MKILGIETSCDETSAAVVEDGTRILSNVIASQIDLHSKFGGVVPEVASRRARGADSARRSRKRWTRRAARSLISTASARSTGPGLIGALIVGAAAAKTIAYGADLPLVAVHHLEAHIYANFLTGIEIEFPLVCLIVSGGHSDLVLMSGHGEYKTLARTRDDAAGEAFDKCARAMGLGYPGGPLIDKLARDGDPNAIAFPRGRVGDTLDFSFSGLKTAVIRYVQSHGGDLRIEDIAASFQQAVVDVLVDHTFRAVEETGVGQVLLAGGVAANSALQAAIKAKGAELGIAVGAPPPVLCTDNAAMAASAGVLQLSAWRNRRTRYGLLRKRTTWEQTMIRTLLVFLILCLTTAANAANMGGAYVLTADSFKHYVEGFNANDQETNPQAIPNAAAWDWLKNNIPLFECPDQEITERPTTSAGGPIASTSSRRPTASSSPSSCPTVGWAGKHNTISCAAGHHLYEGRWLRDPRYLDDYSVFWFRKGGEPRRYSFWAADAIWARSAVTGDNELVDRPAARPDPQLRGVGEGPPRPERPVLADRRPRRHGGLDRRQRLPRDDQQLHVRRRAGDRQDRGAGRQAEIAEEYPRKGRQDQGTRGSEALGRQGAVLQGAAARREQPSWPMCASCTATRRGTSTCPIRQFAAPGSSSWTRKGFYAPFGPTTAEQRHPKFAVAYQGHECQWNGPSWPYATAVTLTAMANLLNNHRREGDRRSRTTSIC